MSIKIESLPSPHDATVQFIKIYSMNEMHMVDILITPWIDDSSGGYHDKPYLLSFRDVYLFKTSIFGYVLSDIQLDYISFYLSAETKEELRKSGHEESIDKFSELMFSTIYKDKIELLYKHLLIDIVDELYLGTPPLEPGCETQDERPLKE